jgi:hypothetical protein
LEEGCALGRPESWQPDPTGRWHLRWWDGRAWTEHVTSHEQAGTDPLTEGDVTPPPPRSRPNGRAGTGGQAATDPLRVHGVEHLALPRTRTVLDEHRGPDEEVHAVVIGRPEQVLVALDERLLVIKIGMTAGATGAARVTSIPYEDVSGILVSTGLVVGTLTVQTAGTCTTPGEVRAIHGMWTAKDADNPWKLPNVVPLSKTSLAEFADDIELIRSFVQQAQRPPEPTVVSFPAPPDRSSVEIAAQLRLLADLHGLGALDDAELAEATERVLGPAVEDAFPPPAHSEG